MIIRKLTFHESEDLSLITIQVRIVYPDDQFVDEIKGVNKEDALKNAAWNWPEATIEFIAITKQ